MQKNRQYEIIDPSTRKCHSQVTTNIKQDPENI